MTTTNVFLFLSFTAIISLAGYCLGWYWRSSLYKKQNEEKESKKESKDYRIVIALRLYEEGFFDGLNGNLEQITSARSYTSGYQDANKLYHSKYDQKTIEDVRLGEI